MTIRILDQNLLTKIAIYWPLGTLNEDGERGYGVPEERDCHWESKKQEITDAAGKVFVSDATVFMNGLVMVGGHLWLSSATVLDPPGTGLAEAPEIPPNHPIIRQVGINPDIDNYETLYKAFL